MLNNFQIDVCLFKADNITFFWQQIDLERKTNQLAERNFDSNINQKQSEIYTLEQKIRALSHERDSILADSRDRVELSLKKAELENHKKKHKKMQVYFWPDFVL